METVSKSRLKAKALEYFRQIERSGEPVIVTDRGRPVLKIVPYRLETATALQELRGSVVRYEQPTEPIAVGEWESLPP